MRPAWTSVVSMGLWTLGAAAWAASPISVEIVTPDGRALREIAVDAPDGAERAYLEAERGARYRIRVHNPSGERLGLVVAVDGRNIISGSRSELGRDEPMYVIDAGETQELSGWRASLDEINEFYFTDWRDSYAEAFADRSARGVIAVAVYRELRPQPPPRAWQPRGSEPDRAADAASAPAEASADRARRDDSAGTGYGDRREDRVREVRFVAAAYPHSRHFIKYEWRETLCRKRVIDCDDVNRFWDDSALGFAPPPPRRVRPD